MSTSDLYRVYRTTASRVAEFRNGWGTAPLLWDHLSANFAGGRKWIFEAEYLWPLANDERVPNALRLAHAFTFDGAVCPINRTSEFADACDEVATTCAKDGYVNHWAAVAAELRKAKARARQIGWALSCTSVNDVWCTWKGDPKPWDIFSVLEPAVSV